MDIVQERKWWLDLAGIDASSTLTDQAAKLCSFMRAAESLPVAATLVMELHVLTTLMLVLPFSAQLAADTVVACKAKVAAAGFQVHSEQSDDDAAGAGQQGGKEASVAEQVHSAWRCVLVLQQHLERMHSICLQLDPV